MTDVLLLQQLSLCGKCPRHKCTKYNHLIHYSLPNNKILDRPKLKASADDNLNVAKMMISLYDMERKHSGKRRK